MLDVIADNDGLSASDAIRQLIRQRYAQVGAGVVEGANFTQRTVAKLMEPVRAATVPARPSIKPKQIASPFKKVAKKTPKR